MQLKPFAVLICLLCSACATQSFEPVTNPPGILEGIFHGLFAPIALIASFFTDIRVYAFPNNGIWYDCGFVAGIYCWAVTAIKR